MDERREVTAVFEFSLRSLEILNDALTCYHKSLAKKHNSESELELLIDICTLGEGICEGIDEVKARNKELNNE
jgi:hypothetical protein